MYSLLTSELVRDEQCTLKLTEKKETPGKYMCAHCSPLSGSKITNSGLILLVFRPLRIGRKPPRCWGFLFLVNCIAICQELATTFIITIAIVITIIISIIIHRYYHHHPHQDLHGWQYLKIDRVVASSRFFSMPAKLRK